MFSTALIGLAAIFAIAQISGTARARALSNGKPFTLHSRPGYHGCYVAIWTTVPALFLLIVWSVIAPTIIDRLVLSGSSDAVSALAPAEVSAFLRDARAIAFGGIVTFRDETKEAAALIFSHYAFVSDFLMLAALAGLVAIGAYKSYGQLTAVKRTRHLVEHALTVLLIACSVVAILTTIGIVLSLVFESVRFFQKVPITEFLFGLQWSPQTALRADQVGSGGAFGAIPLFVGTLLITTIAIVVAAPIGLLSAIYLSDYATQRFRASAKPVLEVLAGIPTVVYGFFAALTVAPFFRNTGDAVGIPVSSESALAAGIVMGIMIIPFVSSLSDDVISAVPQSLRDGSAGLGATKSETIVKVVLPAALPGIVSALILAISRAVGETMIVVMAAGLAANLTINPFQAVTTVTVQIVTLLIGDQEFDSAKTLAAFALGLVLFCATLILNFIALRVVQKYREQYD